MQLSDTQVYYLKRLVSGPIHHEELRKWDQRPLRGMFLKGLFTLTASLSGNATPLGWTVYQGTLRPKLRKHPENPLFGNRAPARLARAR